MLNRRKVIVVGFNDSDLGLKFISGLRKNLIAHSSRIPTHFISDFEFETPHLIVRVVPLAACIGSERICADHAFGPEWLKDKVRGFEGKHCAYSYAPPCVWADYIAELERKERKTELNAAYDTAILSHPFVFPLSQYGWTARKPTQRPEIKKVHFSGPVTCVIWTDGTKTVVRCQDGETLDPEKGLAMAVAKKFLGTNATGSNYYDAFQKWLPKKKMKTFIAKSFTLALPSMESARQNLENLIKALGGDTAKRPETCRERLKREHPEFVGPEHLGGCYSCPHRFGYTTEPGLCHLTGCGSPLAEDALCAKCWDRPVETKHDGYKAASVFFDETPARSGSKPWGEKNPKFELTTETKEFMGRTLHRIRALRDIYLPAPNEKQKPIFFVKKGTLGGWLEKEKNLSHNGSCWVGEDAHVMEEAVVKGSAYVYGHAVVRKKARVEHNAIVCGHAIVQDNAIVGDEAYVHDEAIIRDNAIVSHNANVGGMSDIGDNIIVSRDCILTRNLVGRGSYTYEGVKME